MQRQLLSPDKSVRSQKPNKSIRTQKYKHYDNKHIKSHIYSSDRTHTSTPSFQHKSKCCKELRFFFLNAKTYKQTRTYNNIQHLTDKFPSLSFRKSTLFSILV